MLNPATIGIILRGGRPLLKLVMAALFGMILVLAFALLVMGSVYNLIIIQQQQLATCGPGLSAVGPDPQPVTARGGQLRVNIATWNTYAFNSTARVIAGIRYIGRAADVIGLQELTPDRRRDAVSAAIGDTFGVSRGNNAVRIIWKKARYSLLAQGSERVFGVRRIEGGVSGTSIGPKSIQWVQLRDKYTGAVFFVANHHLVPTIDRAGRPDTRNPLRLRLYREQMDAMAKLVTRLRRFGPTMVTGDFNVAAKADAAVQAAMFPYVFMGRNGLTSSWRQLGFSAGPTHGNRHIDYIWTTPESARAVAHRVLPKSGSDHSPLVAAITDRRELQASASSARAGTQRTDDAPLPSIDRLSDEQVRVAAGLYATTLAVGRELGWSAAKTGRAALIVLATGMQESTMGINARKAADRHGDAGVLGQRTRPGWYGTLKEVNDPAKAGRWFLLGKDISAADVAAAARNGSEPAGSVGYHIPGLNQIEGFERLPLTVAAQRVQRSAFPSAYARWESLAESIVTALRGTMSAATGVSNSPAIDCGAEETLSPAGPMGNCPPTGMPGERGLQPDALRALRCVADRFPQVKDIGGIYQTNAGDHPSGRAVDVMIPDYTSAQGMALGKSIAEWAKTHRSELGVTYIVWREHIWNAQRDSEGWRYCGGSSATCYTGPDDSASHRNHVHISVQGNQGTGFGRVGSQAAANAGTGRWVMPLAEGTYTVGCSITCYSGHTGQDFGASIGTPIRSSNDGVVVQSRALRGPSGYYSYGNVIQIRDNANPNVTVWYAHLSTRSVVPDQRVSAGQVIGTSGNTGNSTGPHLHYEIRRNGSPIDPIPVLRDHGLTP